MFIPMQPVTPPWCQRAPQQSSAFVILFIPKHLCTRAPWCQRTPHMSSAVHSCLFPSHSPRCQRTPHANSAIYHDALPRNAPGVHLPCFLAYIATALQAHTGWAPEGTQLTTMQAGCCTIYQGMWRIAAAAPGLGPAGSLLAMLEPYQGGLAVSMFLVFYDDLNACTQAALICCYRHGAPEQQWCLVIVTWRPGAPTLPITPQPSRPPFRLTFGSPHQILRCSRPSCSTRLRDRRKQRASGCQVSPRRGRMTRAWSIAAGSM